MLLVDCRGFVACVLRKASSKMVDRCLRLNCVKSYIPYYAANFIVARFEFIGYLSKLSAIVQRPRIKEDK